MTETTHEVVDEWPLPNGDKVIVVRATIKKVDDDGSVSWSRLFHFTVVAPNGRKVATSGQTFKRARNAKRAAARNFPPVVGD